MNHKKIAVMIIIVAFIIIYIANNSFAYEYQTTNYTLFYKNNYSELKEDIKTYISDIDDYLIPNSSYLHSDILTENYDFITNFAIDYVINNREAYAGKIIDLVSFTYDDIDNQKHETNKYIDVEEIYKLTDKYFGINYYYIINNNINKIDDYVSLSDYTDRLFLGNIKDISIDKNSDMILASINYDNGDKYKYTFKIVNNVLKIYNIEVIEWKK